MKNAKRLNNAIREYFISKLGNEMQLIDIMEANADIQKTIEQYAEKDIWTPIEEDAPTDGIYVLLSFENFSIPLVGRYSEDEDGGGFFALGDEKESCLTKGLFVNAWTELPKPYRRIRE